MAAGTVLFARLWPADVKALTDLAAAAEGRAPEVDGLGLPDGGLGGRCIEIAE